MMQAAFRTDVNRRHADDRDRMAERRRLDGIGFVDQWPRVWRDQLHDAEPHLPQRAGDLGVAMHRPLLVAAIAGPKWFDARLDDRNRFAPAHRQPERLFSGGEEDFSFRTAEFPKDPPAAGDVPVNPLTSIVRDPFKIDRAFTAGRGDVRVSLKQDSSLR